MKIHKELQSFIHYSLSGQCHVICLYYAHVLINHNSKIIRLLFLAQRAFQVSYFMNADGHISTREVTKCMDNQDLNYHNSYQVCNVQKATALKL